MAQSDGLLCTTYYDVLLRIPIKMGKAQMHISIPDHYRIDVATEHPDFNILSLIFVTLDPLPGTKCEACRFCGCARLFFFFLCFPIVCAGSRIQLDGGASSIQSKRRNHPKPEDFRLVCCMSNMSLGMVSAPRYAFFTPSRATDLQIAYMVVVVCLSFPRPQSRDVQEKFGADVPVIVAIKLHYFVCKYIRSSTGPSNKSP